MNDNNIKYKTPFNVLKNNFLTKAERVRNNNTLKVSSNILTKGKRHPLIKSWKTQRRNRNEKPYNFLNRRHNLWENKGHSNFFNTKINMSKYTNILGSGGFGMIVSNTRGKDVVKLYYRQNSCKEMNAEYVSFLSAYNALEDYPYPQLTIPEPKKIDNRNIQFKNTKFLCGIEMKRVAPIPFMGGTNGLIHIILKEGYKPMMNKEVSKNYSNPISNSNPSRGFFATGTYITSDILTRLTEEQRSGINSIDDIAFRMGYGFAILVVVAELYPNDVEYCLGMVDSILNVVILDFGMAMPINYSIDTRRIADIILYGDKELEHSTGISNDLYFPDNDDPTFEAFIAGIAAVKSLIQDPKKNEILDIIISVLVRG